MRDANELLDEAQRRLATDVEFSVRILAAVEALDACLPHGTRGRLVAGERALVTLAAAVGAVAAETPS